jgi:hypothetical protein
LDLCTCLNNVFARGPSLVDEEKLNTPKMCLAHIILLILWVKGLSAVNDFVMDAITRQWTNLGYTGNVNMCDALLVSAPEYKGNLNAKK